MDRSEVSILYQDRPAKDLTAGGRLDFDWSDTRVSTDLFRLVRNKNKEVMVVSIMRLTP